MVSQSQRKPFMNSVSILRQYFPTGAVQMILQPPSLASKLNLEITRTTGIHQH